MTFDNFDAAMLVASPLLLPIAGASDMLETDCGPTLDDALRAFERAGRAPGAGRAGGGGATDEAAAPDLWVTDAMRNAAGPAAVEQAGDTGVESSGPSTEGAIDTTAPQTDAQEPQDHPLIKEKLSLAKIGHALGGRQFDSTDYYFEEMSTADWEWALKNFKDDVYAGVLEFTAGATSQPEADQMAQAYLNSIGLGGIVRAGAVPVGPPPVPDDAIVVTARTYHHPTNYMPPLWMDDNSFSSFDFANFNAIDASAHMILVDPDVVLTQEAQEALDRLNIMIDRVTNYLNNLPPYGVIMTPKGPSTVAELRAVWALTDFHITKHGTDYSINGIPGHPGAGAADYRNGNPMLETSIDNLIRFMEDTDRALFYVLHELGHVTWLGYQELLAVRPPGGPPPSNEVWGPSERFFNDFSQFMANLMGHPLPANFDPNDYKFSPDPQMTFVPDPQSGGSNGGESGGHGNLPEN